MTVAHKIVRPQAAPALFRLLSESALSRAAFAACGFPLALVDAAAPGHPVTHVNSAFEGYFGWREADVLGRSLATLIFGGDETALQMLVSDPTGRVHAGARGHDGSVRPVELALGLVRGVEGDVTHWVVTFADRSEPEKLRAELEQLRASAAAS